MAERTVRRANKFGRSRSGPNYAIKNIVVPVSEFVPRNSDINPDADLLANIPKTFKGAKVGDVKERVKIGKTKRA